MKKILLLFIFSVFVFGEDRVSIKIMGLSLHPNGAKSSEVMPLKFDKKGYLVPNIGLIFAYDREISDGIYIRFSQGLYFDCALKPAGFTQVNLRGDIFDSGETRINIGCGPTIIYRKSWKILEGYNPTSFYKEKGSIEYTYLWYGGDIEYNKKLEKNGEFQLSFVPGYPALMHLSFGLANTTGD